MKQPGFRGTQPYRKAGGRAAGVTLDAMMRGKPAYLPNPQTLLRGTLRQRRKRKRGRSLADRMTSG